ncbi:Putative Mei2-like protein [Chondrus crispus]|uniref:Putative Mei2-like protein n=1 Tax=Chondrus crispus TaxID=2769 RepID=R7QQB9_CHOCR|nr:Putative Mei2-like protein [Chondrus crispus]CDF39565.1 Putative Mei2-like protein [Chondrus crispus]|eukprot:XP_005709859.1 Putative Mei2-like protein [Chondrus crispus]
MMDPPRQATVPPSSSGPLSSLTQVSAATSTISSSAAPGISALAPQFDLALTASARRSAPPIGSLSPQGTPFGTPSPANINHLALREPSNPTHQQQHQHQQQHPLRSPPLLAKEFLQEAEAHSNFDFRSPNLSSAHAYSTSASSVPLHQHPDPLFPNTIPPQTAPLPQPAADFDLFGLATLDLGPPVFDNPLQPSPALHQPLSSPTRLPHTSPLFPTDTLHAFDPPQSPRKSPPAISPPPLLSPSSRSPREQPHPTRCVLLRNIPPGIDDDDIRSVLQQYGPLRDLGAQQRSRGGRGSVLATYYDLRHARAAVKTLHEAVHFGRRLDVRFQCPTDTSMSNLAMTSPVSTSSGTIGGPASPCSNQGTLVVFNLDNSTSAEDIRALFSEYGDVKEIRATPNKRHHKFVEFYDVRDAEKAMRSLNKTEVAGKRIKIEISRPGGRASNLPRNASPGNAKSQQAAIHHFHVQQRHHPSSNHAAYPPDISGFQSASPRRQAVDSSHSSNQHMASAFLPGMHPGVQNPTHSAFGEESEISPLDEFGGVGRDLANLIGSKSFDAGIGHLQPSSYDASYGNGHRSQEFDFGLMHGSYDALAENQIATSSGMEQRPDLHQMYSDHAIELSKFSNPPMMPSSAPRYPADSYIKALYNSPDSDDSRKAMSPIQSPPERSPFSLGKAGGPGAGIAGLNLYKNAVGDEIPTGNAFPSNRGHNRTAMTSLGRRMSGLHVPQGVIGGDRGYAQRHTSNKGVVGAAQNGGNKAYFNQQQGNSKYALDIRKVRSGEETRTALMIRNIPNKYNQKMLLSTLEEEHRGNFDFIYLPIDFKNKCNVGYAFINFTKPQYIEPFYHAFHGKKWGRFNSEKVCEITFARIQGRQQLIAHFQNSSLLLEDPKCRPVIFDANGRQEEFPIGSHVRTRRGPSSRDSSQRACESSPPYSPTKQRGRGHA